MGKLAPHTINQYRWRLKKLRKVLPIMADDDPERVRAIREIEKLTNQLGMEMNDLEIALARGPGRPRTLTNLTVYEQALAEVKEVPKTNEPTHEQLHAKKMEDLKQRVIANDPELAKLVKQREEEERSERELKAMIDKANESLGGDENAEGPKQATDEAGTVAGDK